MDFTREPIIETIVTPKEGCKLVVRSSKSTGQEEYFVDAVEIVSFGHALFFRSLERPKAFLVPVSDYEILEVKEARMVLKNAGLDRSIKIGGGRDGGLKASREAEKAESLALEEEIEEGKTEAEEIAVPSAEATGEARPDMRLDKKRDRRRHYRKRRGKEEREEAGKEGVAEIAVPPLEDEKISISPPEFTTKEEQEQATPISSTVFSSLLQPPPNLISETISRYRQNDLFKGAFYLTEEEQYKPHDKVQELLSEDDEEEMVPTLQEPTFSADANLDLFSDFPIQETFSEQEGREAQEEREEIVPEQTQSDFQEEQCEISSFEEGENLEQTPTEEEPPLESSVSEEPHYEAALPLFAEEERTVKEEELKPVEEGATLEHTEEHSKEELHHPENTL